MPSEAIASPAGAAAAGPATRYDSLEIFFHWATAVLVAVMYVLAQGWGFVERGSAFQHGLQSLHVSLGLLLVLVLVARVAWKAGPGRRVAPASAGLVQLATSAVHFGLYALLAAVVVLGMLNRWGHQGSLSFFGLLTIPSPYGFSKDQAHSIGELHGLAANTVVIVAGLHACAALAHHYVLRDGIMRRMLPAGRAG